MADAKLMLELDTRTLDQPLEAIRDRFEVHAEQIQKNTDAIATLRDELKRLAYPLRMVTGTDTPENLEALTGGPLMADSFEDACRQVVIALDRRAVELTIARQRMPMDELAKIRDQVKPSAYRAAADLVRLLTEPTKPANAPEVKS